MDPDAAWKALIECLEDDNHWDALFHCDELIEWAQKGGFVPDKLSLKMLTALSIGIRDQADEDEDDGECEVVIDPNRERIISFEDAKNGFRNRFTMEHVPAWAKEQRDDGTYYAPQYRTDREWYDNTLFESRNIGFSCLSLNQSWPLGFGLPKPYSIEQK